MPGVLKIDSKMGEKKQTITLLQYVPSRMKQSHSLICSYNILFSIKGNVITNIKKNRILNFTARKGIETRSILK